MKTITPIARERSHTLHFLNEIGQLAPVFLDTEIDMTRILEHRATARQNDRRYSFVTYVLYAAGRVLAEHPEANAAIRGRRWPQIARYRAVNGKLTLDKTLHGHRVVLATVVADLDRAVMDDIQAKVDHFRDGDPDEMPEFARVRALHKLPWPFGGAAFRAAIRPLKRRGTVLGTFAVTSLGHRPVDGFHSMGGTTITLGVGQVLDRPVVRKAQLAIAPVMRLNMAFDHRVIDGAEAADVLASIRARLERFDTELAHDVPQVAAETGQR